MKRGIFVSVFAVVFIFGAVFVYAQTSVPTITSVEPFSSCGTRINFDSSVGGQYEFIVSTRSDFKTGSDTVSFDAKSDSGALISGSGAFVATSTSARMSYWGSKFYNPNVNYWFKVRVFPSDGSKESDWSAPKNATTPAFQNVGSPQNILGEWASDGYKIKVSWARGNPTPAKFDPYGGFEIYRATSNDGGNTYSAFSLVERVPSSLSNYEDNDVRGGGAGLNKNFSHKYKIHAYQSDFECSLGSKFATDNPNQLALSLTSSEIIFPARPTNLVTSATADKKIKLNWQDNSRGAGSEDMFKILRKFGSGGGEFVAIGQTNANQTNYIDGNIQKGETYTYKVQACRSDSCSAFTDEVTGIVGVEQTNFSSKGIYYVSGIGNGKFAQLYFAWPTDAKFVYTVERREKADGTSYAAVCGGEGECRDENVPLGKSYLYRLETKSGSDVAYSPESEFNLDIKYVSKGAAWSAYKTTDQTRGVGWISLNSDTPKAGGGVHSPSIKYSVQVDSNGLLSGVGWGHVANHTQPNEHGYGWFSFNEGDLDGCPSGPPCNARLEISTNKVSGWARFLGPKDNKIPDAWDGWMSLRGTDTSSGKEYGLCLGNATGTEVTVDGKKYRTGLSCRTNLIEEEKSVLSGVSWAGSIVGGWFAFGTSTDVTIVSPPQFMILPQLQPPRLAVRESMQFSIVETDLPNASVPAKWGVKPKNADDGSIVWGGNQMLGSFSPLNTAKNTSTTYMAPDDIKQVTIVATSTDAAKPGSATTSIDIVLPYNFNCVPESTSSIRLVWGTNYKDANYPDHELTLRGGLSEPPAQILIDKWDPKTDLKTPFLHDNLASSTTYYYALETQYKSNFIKKIATTSCATFGGGGPGIITDAPTKLSAFGHSASKIYVNWKDNTTTTNPYKFQVQRIKVTPATTTNFKATSISPSEIRLNWGNITSSTPYYHEFQRSTSTGGLMFREYPDDPEREGDPSLHKSPKIGTYNSSNPPGGIQTYTYLDSLLQEATTYYYRMRACSSIDLRDSYGTPALGNSGKPNPACGKYDNVFDSSKTVSTTTPPKAPTNFTATADSSSQITLRWTDNSLRESGFEIKRNGQAFIIPAKPGANPVTYVDSGLNSGTTYSYTIRAFYDIPPAPPYTSGGRMYSTSVGAQDTTHFVVTVSISPGGSGTVTDDSGAIRCPVGVLGASCTAEFPWGTNVLLTASPNVNFGFENWSGNWSETSCSGGARANPCEFTGNASVAANFRVTNWSLSVGISGATGTVSSAPAGINCVYNGVSISGTCSNSFSADSTVTLTATSSPLSSFSKWGGNCSGGSPTCSLLMNSNKSAIVEFIQKPLANIMPGYLLARFSGAVSGAWESIFGSSAPDVEVSWETEKDGVIREISEFALKTWGKFKKILGETAWWIESKLAKLTSQEPDIARGADLDIENYYLHAATTTGSVYKDEKVEPDTVYLYRVRVMYEDGRTNPFTIWSNLGAVKTMRDVGGGNFTDVKRPICVRNSYCDTSLTLYKSTADVNKIPLVEESEQQCSVNAECRDVGRADQTYRER